MKARDFTGPDYYMRAAEVDELQRLVSLLPSKPLVINIGAGLGTSAAAMLEARPDSTVFSIDIEPCPEERALLKHLRLPVERCIRILSPSQSVAMLWRWPVDAVFIDGGHSCVECFNDFTLWNPLVKPGGWVAFHDYHSQIQVLESVTMAIDDLKITWPVIARIDTLIAYEVPK